jgi:hypothetical protein
MTPTSAPPPPPTPPMDRDTAEQHIAAILDARIHLVTAETDLQLHREKIVTSAIALWHCKAWKTLGYKAFQDLFKGQPSVPRIQAQDMAYRMSAAGLSTRAIAAVVGTNQTTAARWLREHTDLDPDPVEAFASTEPDPTSTHTPRIRGVDGKSYAARKPKSTPRPRTTGAETMDKVDRLTRARADAPDATKDELALMARLAGHQEVRLLELIDAAPQPFKDLIADDSLKLAVAQEILEAPLFTPDEQVQLARKFTSGTFSQIGTAKTTFRPIIAFIQSARSAIRTVLLNDTAMTIEQARALYPEFDRDEQTRAEARARAEADGLSPLKWANNFSTAIQKQRTADEVALTRLQNARPALPAMAAFDRFLMSAVVRDMQFIRTSLYERYVELESWITELAGADHVNHPDAPTAAPAFIDADILDLDTRREG